MQLHKPVIRRAAARVKAPDWGAAGCPDFRTGVAYWLAAAGAAAAAEAPFFVFCFLGFLTCFWVGGEYELTALLPAGAAAWAKAAEVPTASERPAKTNVSFFMRDSPCRLQVVEPTRFMAASGR